MSHDDIKTIADAATMIAFTITGAWIAVTWIKHVWGND